MVKDHFYYLVEKFGLPSSNKFTEVDKITSVDDLIVHKFNDNMYIIKNSYNKAYIFTYIPTEEIANKIIQHAKDTELLFI